MPASPRVLFSIDYEPWFALFRRFDSIADPVERQDLDGGFSSAALETILEMLGGAKASFYLVGEIAEWYPDVPRKIVAAGHELGLHCRFHRSLLNVDELASDLQATSGLCRLYGIRGYRAPMIGIQEAGYPLLEEAGFTYSSSTYAPAGTLVRRGQIWELPVSTLRLFGSDTPHSAPRDFSLRLLMQGEIPYGSSFTIGLLNGLTFKILERELKAGNSPVIILHPYELVRPASWGSRSARSLITNPLLWPFTWNKTQFAERLCREFPVAPLGAYLDEVLADRRVDQGP